MLGIDGDFAEEGIGGTCVEAFCVVFLDIGWVVEVEDIAGLALDVTVADVESLNVLSSLVVIKLGA